MTTVTLDVPEPVVPLLDTIGDRLSLVLEMGLSRLAPVSFLAYSEAVSFLIQSPSAEDIIEFRFSAEIEERVRILLEKNGEGRLSQAEETELDRLVQLEDQLGLLKAKTLARKYQSN